MSVNVKQNGNLTPVASLTKAITPVSLGDCYSTEERQVGCWINGKPLYKKTIELNTFSFSSSWQTIYTDSNIDYMAAVELTNGESLMYARLNFQFYQSNLQCASTSSFTLANPRFTILYTKTTDTAGSGIWTPSGAYAEHYSETEHIVGTWIDGSTLYEKTFVQQLSGNTAHIDISAYNMKKAFIYGGFYDIGVTMQSLCEWIGANAYSWAHINTGSQYLYIDCYNSVASNSTIYVTVRYTKNS